MLTVWAVDPDRIRRGQLVPVECTAVLRDADVGTFQVTVTADKLSARVIDGWRLIIQDGDETILSGPVTEVAPDLADRSVTLTGVSDLAALRDRLTYPDPSQPAHQQTAAAYYKRTAAASNVIDDLVYRNAGTGAVAARQVSGLVMVVAEGGNLGATVTANLRFKNLLEEARRLARLGDVTFDAVQDAALIRFRFRVPVDRSRSVRFSDSNGGVTGGSYTLAAPTATTVIVAGQGQGTARTVIERSRATTWARRIEMFKDQRDTDDAAELEQSATEQLDDGMAGAGASFTVTETPGVRFGTDYHLGDTVTVELGEATISEPVRQVELTWDGHGRTAAIVLGDHDQADDKTPAWVNKIKNLDARVRGMEVR